MCYSSLGTVGYRRGVDIVAKQWKPHTEGEFSQPQLTSLRSIEQRAKKKKPTKDTAIPCRSLEANQHASVGGRRFKYQADNGHERARAS